MLSIGFADGKVKNVLNITEIFKKNSIYRFRSASRASLDFSLVKLEVFHSQATHESMELLAEACEVSVEVEKTLNPKDFH